MLSSEKIKSMCCKAIAEGTVLLENDGMLPLKKQDRVAVFGRAQFEYVKAGTGSGGDIPCSYVSNIGDELSKCVRIDSRAERFYRDWIKAHPLDINDGWEVPNFQLETVPSEEFVQELAAVNDKAIVVIARLCGEGFDMSSGKGGYYLTDEEERTIECVAKHFKHNCVIVNSCNTIDMRWVKKYNVGAVVYAYPGGQEGGTGIAMALTGKLPIGGKLTDTIANDLCDYPSHGNFGNKIQNIHVEDIYVGYRYFETFAKDKVLYPFGYGLSYTRFELTCVKAEKSDDIIEISVSVNNVGNAFGKEVVQCYVKKPQGKLGKPARELVAFCKTKLLQPKESDVVTLKIKVSDLVSYDDGGESGYAYAYVLEEGIYEFFIGDNVRSAQKIFEFSVDKTVCIKQCRQAIAPMVPFKRISTQDGHTIEYKETPLKTYDLRERILADLPKGLSLTGDRGIKFGDVIDGRKSVEEFVAQFGEKELCDFVIGEGTCSPKAAVKGTSSCFGGVTEKWNRSGVPIISAVDGPSGVRIINGDASATCIPSEALLACMWSPDDIDGVLNIFAEELDDFGLDIELAPGLNISRHPLCGRRYEYFSEDPLISGLYAAAFCKVFYNRGKSCVIKHFAVNSQEFERGTENEIVSERALREIYLKGFEIAVKSGYVKYIMTSYNRLNGLSNSANYDLTTSVLRNEWGFDGAVMTDWWANIDNTYNNTHNIKNLSAMIRAQNDIYMVAQDATSYDCDLKESIVNGRLTLPELQRSVINILNTIIVFGRSSAKDKNNFTDIRIDDVPVAIYDNMAKCEFKFDNAGLYIVKITYSTNEDGFIQLKEKVLINNELYKTELLKGTANERSTHSVLLELPIIGILSFEGRAEIHKIEVYKIKT